MNYSRFTSLTEFLQDEKISKMISESKCKSSKKEEEETKYILWVTRNSNMYNWCIICMV